MKILEQKEKFTEDTDRVFYETASFGPVTLIHGLCFTDATAYIDRFDNSVAKFEKLMLKASEFGVMFQIKQEKDGPRVYAICRKEMQLKNFATKVLKMTVDEFYGNFEES